MNSMSTPPKEKIDKGFGEMNVYKFENPPK